MDSASASASEPDPARSRSTADAPQATGPVESVPGPAASEADQAITAMYGMHYVSLVRMSAALVDEVGTAEQVVQDSFVALHGAWHRLPDIDMALCYLRRSVVHRSRAVLRRRKAIKPEATEPEATEPEATEGSERPAVISALRTLPALQQEALVLRFYLDLSEGKVASAMGVSPGAARSHIARANAALRGILDLGA